MAFSLANAPAIVERLMQPVLASLNPEEENDFVTAYTPTLQEHLDHLQRVIDCLWEVNLKFNPKKCKFVGQEIDY